MREWRWGEEEIAMVECECEGSSSVVKGLVRNLGMFAGVRIDDLEENASDIGINRANFVKELLNIV